MLSLHLAQVALCLQQRVGGDGSTTSQDVVLDPHLGAPHDDEALPRGLREEAGQQEGALRRAESAGCESVFPFHSGLLALRERESKRVCVWE